MKGRANFSIDINVLDLAKSKYPGQISGMVEEFLRNVVNAPVSDLDDMDQEDMENAIRMKSEMVSEIKGELAALHAQKDRLEKIRRKNAEYGGLTKEEVMEAKALIDGVRAAKY